MARVRNAAASLAIFSIWSRRLRLRYLCYNVVASRTRRELVLLFMIKEGDGGIAVDRGIVTETHVWVR